MCALQVLFLKKFKIVFLFIWKEHIVKNDNDQKRRGDSNNKVHRKTYKGIASANIYNANNEEKKR